MTADKGYDGGRILSFVQGREATVVIPPKSNRRVIQTYDKELYKRRNLIERAFNKLKNWRGSAIRYDRRSIYFLATLRVATEIAWST